ncbi:MAG: universal stress protein YxiE [Candidatus Tectimicrobiota bacterium]|nr:MAG: universal stress protein YxiE [Candidatus Tectomicrobia bacterium]
MFRKVLAATGGSPWSRNAVATAIRLVAATGGELFVAHILEDDPQYQPLAASADPQLRQEIEATGRDILAQAARQAAQAGVPYQTLSAWGRIPEQIVRLAAAHGCDLIVMGTRHLTGGKRLMTGRICNAVIATAPCPVLVVPLVQEA